MSKLRRPDTVTGISVFFATAPTRRRAQLGPRQPRILMAKSVALTMTMVWVAGCTQTGLDRLQRDTGITWTATSNGPEGTPVLLRPNGKSPPVLAAGAAPAAAALTFLDEYRDIFAIENAKAELALAVAGGADALGGGFATFDQTESGVPVDGGRLSLQFDGEGGVALVAGHFVPRLYGLATRPRIGAADAIAIAQADMPKRYGSAAMGTIEPISPQLLIWTLGERPILAWRLLASSATPQGSRVVAEYIIDASTGAIIRSLDALDTAGVVGVEADGSGQGVYGNAANDAKRDLKHFPVIATTPPNKPPYLLEQMASATTGDLRADIFVDGAAPSEITSKDLHNWDRVSQDPGSAVDAYAYLLATEQWWGQHGMTNSYDSKNGALRILAHDPTNLDNAGWDRTGTIHIYDSNELPLSTAAALDVMAHEYQHAIDQYRFFPTEPADTSPAKALDESMGDVMGQFVEQQHARELPYQSKRTLVGEAVWPGGLRNFVSPHDGFKKTRDHVNDPIVPSAEGHVNAGIFNAAWGLIAFGGRNGTSGVEIPVADRFAMSQQLYLTAILKGAFWAGMSYRDVGLIMSSTAFVTFNGDDRAKIVACAFYAVGALTKDDLQNEFQIKLANDKACPSDPPSDMSGPRDMFEAPLDLAGRSTDMADGGTCPVGMKVGQCCTVMLTSLGCVLSCSANSNGGC
jgi:Zn-dependent metalloprotease